MGGPLGAGAAGLGAQPMDAAFHPAAPTICAAGLVSGGAEVCAWAPPPLPGGDGGGGGGGGGGDDLDDELQRRLDNLRRT